MYFGGPTRACRGMLGMAHGDIPGYRTGVSWVWTYTRDHPRGPVSRGLKRVQKGVPKMVIFDPPKITDFGPYFRPSRRCEKCDTHVKKCKKRARSWRGNGTFCISRFRKNTTNRGKRSRPCIQGVRKSSILDLFRSKKRHILDHPLDPWSGVRSPRCRESSLRVPWGHRHLVGMWSPPAQGGQKGVSKLRPSGGRYPGGHDPGGSLL